MFDCVYILSARVDAEEFTTVMFNSSTTNQTECIMLTIHDDEVFEGAESFTFQLTTEQLQLSINPVRRMAIMKILDLDGECVATYRIPS